MGEIDQNAVRKPPSSRSRDGGWVGSVSFSFFFFFFGTRGAERGTGDSERSRFGGGGVAEKLAALYIYI